MGATLVRFKNTFLKKPSGIGYARLINIGLRGVTLVSKFILVFFLAKFLDPRDLGLYGLFVATIGFGIYLIGFEFYTYTIRELIGTTHENRSRIIKNQFALYLLMYFLCLPLLVLFFSHGGLPWSVFWWFLVVLVIEHIAQELNRILIAFSDQLYAGLVLFIRSGLWGIVVIAAQWLSPALRSLEFVLLMWLISCLIACLLAIKRIANHIDSIPGFKIDIAWILIGVKIAFPMLVASLAIRGIFTFDKYFVESVGGLEILGSYVLFIGISTSVISIINAGVVDFSYPKIIAASRLKDKVEFKREMALLQRSILLMGSFMIPLCGVVGYFSVGYIGKSVYIDNIYILYWLLAAVAINILSLIPHIGLYSLGKDRVIVVSSILGFIVFLIVSYFLEKHYGVFSIPLAMCSAWLSIFLWKVVAYRAAVLEFNN